MINRRDNNEYGNIQNWQYSITKESVTPEVVVDVTELFYSDSYAGRIIKVSDSKKTFWYQKYKVIAKNDTSCSEIQYYDYIIDPYAPVYAAYYSKSKKGYYRRGSQGKIKVQVGLKKTYIDPTR